MRLASIIKRAVEGAPEEGKSERDFWTEEGNKERRRQGREEEIRTRNRKLRFLPRLGAQDPDEFVKLPIRYRREFQENMERIEHEVFDIEDRLAEMALGKARPGTFSRETIPAQPGRRDVRPLNLDDIESLSGETTEATTKPAKDSDVATAAGGFPGLDEILSDAVSATQPTEISSSIGSDRRTVVTADGRTGGRADVSDDEMQAILDAATAAPRKTVPSGKSQELTNDDLDVVLKEGTVYYGGEEPAAQSGDLAGNDEADLDALLAEAALGGESDGVTDGDIDRMMATDESDDLDAILSSAASSLKDDAASSGTDDDDASGAMSQDDIDALLAGVGGTKSAGSGASAPAVAATANAGGNISQDEIDSLLADARATATPDKGKQPAPAGKTSTPAAADDIGAFSGDDEPADSASGDFSQDDIDSLLAGTARNDSDAPEPDGTSDLSQEDINALLAGASDDAAADSGGAMSQDEIDDLLKDAAGAGRKQAVPADDATGADDGDMSQADIDALLAGAGKESGSVRGADAPGAGSDPSGDESDELGKLLDDMDDALNPEKKN